MNITFNVPDRVAHIPKRHRDRPTGLLAIVVVLLFQAGCGGSQRWDEVDVAQPQAPVGHVIPAHKPKNFPDAVRRLRALDEEIGRAPADAKSLAMATDIAGWLPEIAAESDMPEAPWREVDQLSSTLVTEYRAPHKTSEGGAGSTRSTGPSLTALEAILAKSDPTWFDVSKPTSASR
jgi:hypothetical protein